VRTTFRGNMRPMTVFCVKVSMICLHIREKSATTVFEDFKQQLQVLFSWRLSGAE
jgi:hypothetical protein